MLQYLIKITDNTLAVTIVMAFMLYLAVKAAGGKKYLVIGTVLGSMAALTYAVLKRNTGFAVREYYGLGVMLPAIALSVIFLVMVWRSFKLKSRLSLHLFKFTTGILLGLALAYGLPDILLSPFEFAVGMETIYNADFLYKVMGYLGALLIMFLTGLAVYKLADKTPPNLVVVLAFAAVLIFLLQQSLEVVQILAARNMTFSPGLLLRVFFTLLLIMFLPAVAAYQIGEKTSRRWLIVLVLALIFIYAIHQFQEMVQILAGRSTMPRPRWLMRALITMLGHKNWFAYAYMILLGLWATFLIIKVRLTALTGSNPAQIRRLKADHRRQLRYCGLAAACLVISLITITTARSYANREVEISPPIEILADNGQVVLAIEQINDGNLHRLQYKSSSGTMVRFIVIKKSESAYGVGLDACDICGPSGYYQRKGQVVCKLCDVVMNISTIGFPGGCNPVPLKFNVSGGKMIIRTEDLEAESKRFE